MKSLASYKHPGRDSRANRDSDILRRLGTVETSVSELKSQVSGILAILPHLATKADVADVGTEVAQLKGEMWAAISGLETRIIKWIVATLLTSTGLAFTIAKFVH